MLNYLRIYLSEAIHPVNNANVLFIYPQALHSIIPNKQFGPFTILFFRNDKYITNIL